MQNFITCNNMLKSITCKMKTNIKYLPVVSITLLFLASCSGDPERYEVKEIKLNEAVYASGQVMPEEYFFMEVNTPEKIRSIMVNEGDLVKTGSVLAILGSKSEERQADILTSQVAIAREQATAGSSELEEMLTRIEAARVKMIQDEENAQRYEDLVESKAVSEKEAEKFRLTAQTSKAEYESMRQQYASRKKDLQNRLLQSQQQLAQFHQSTENNVLISPLEGKVFQIFHKEGNMVQPGEPVILVGNYEKYILELLVDERDIARIKEGQKVLFKTEIQPDKHMEARINKIVPVLQNESRSFEVEAQVLSTEEIFPQATVEANIVIRENVNSLVIPTDYLMPGDSVLRVDNKDLQMVKVTTGTRDGSWLEIKSGLKSGDIIQKPVSE